MLAPLYNAPDTMMVLVLGSFPRADIEKLAHLNGIPVCGNVMDTIRNFTTPEARKKLHANMVLVQSKVF